MVHWNVFDSFTESMSKHKNNEYQWPVQCTCKRLWVLASNNEYQWPVQEAMSTS